MTPRSPGKNINMISMIRIRGRKAITPMITARTKASLVTTEARALPQLNVVTSVRGVPRALILPVRRSPEVAPREDVGAVGEDGEDGEGAVGGADRTTSGMGMGIGGVGEPEAWADCDSR